MACTSSTPENITSETYGNLQIFKTDSVRVIRMNEREIAYEYNDQDIKLAQLGEEASRFCENFGAYDTVLVDMVLTNRHNYRRAFFECKKRPALVP